MKIYTSKAGLMFQISTTQRPASDGIVCWTQAEFDWIKVQKLAPDEYQLIHNLKLGNYLYSPIPEVEISEAARLANIYAEKIKKQLISANGMDQKKDRESAEIPEQENGNMGLFVRLEAGSGDSEYAETPGSSGGNQECTNSSAAAADESTDNLHRRF